MIACAMRHYSDTVLLIADRAGGDGYLYSVLKDRGIGGRGASARVAHKHDFVQVNEIREVAFISARPKSSARFAFERVLHS